MWFLTSLRDHVTEDAPLYPESPVKNLTEHFYTYLQMLTSWHCKYIEEFLPDISNLIPCLHALRTLNSHTCYTNPYVYHSTKILKSQKVAEIFLSPIVSRHAFINISCVMGQSRQVLIVRWVVWRKVVWLFFFDTGIKEEKVSGIITCHSQFLLKTIFSFLHLYQAFW